MILCMLKEMDFGVLEFAVLGNVVLLIVLLVVLFYTICRLRKATLKNKLEETLPYSDTTDLVPQRYSTLCGLKSSNNRQNGISILSGTSGHLENFQAIKKSNRMSNFLLEKSPTTSAMSTTTPFIMSPGSGPPAYFSATLPLPSKKKGGGGGGGIVSKAVAAPIKVPMHWTPPPPYWIALPPPQTAFQYIPAYTTLPAVLKKHHRCRHEQPHHILRNNGYPTTHHHGNHHSSSSNNQSNGVIGSRRLVDSSSPHNHCMVVHNCGKKQVHMQEDI